MKTYLEQQLQRCILKLDEYANQKGPEAVEQWHYWRGALTAYRDALAHDREGEPAERETASV